ncbi:MAG: nucleotidyltransferase domain-containing protein [Bacteroidales bacterium]|nr:nucleotidyltransferase domain-containing protein [Bacteroidales bacterium]
MLHKEHLFKQKITELREREKELRCLYKVEEAIAEELSFDALFYRIISLIPYGWQYPAVCKAKVTYEGVMFKEPGWKETNWSQSAPIEVDEKTIGKIEVFYTEFRKFHKDSPFLPEEQKLLKTIAKLVNNYIFGKKLVNTVDMLKSKSEKDAAYFSETLTLQNDQHWKWRLMMVEALAKQLNFDHFGIKGLYLIGSTKEATAGPASDIDLLIHVDEPNLKKAELHAWLEGWSLCLDEINFNRTGNRTGGLIETHMITDTDIKNKTSFAVMLHSLSNSAKPIKVRD